MKRITTISVLILLILPFSSNAQSNWNTLARDEVLITIAGQSGLEVMRVSPASVRFYHRLGSLYLAGTERMALSSLKRSGIEAVIVDDKPWTQSYAVVAKPHPGKVDVNLSDVRERVIFRGEDFLVIKSSPEAFDRLRQQGFVCIEIEQQEIPVDATLTVLPRSAVQKDGVVSGIVDSLIRFVSDTTIRDYIQAMQNFGTRYWNNANRDSVSRWVRAKYLEMGITDSKLDSFQYSSTWQANVVATIPGTVDATKEFIVGGHHDCTSSPTTNAPGADDNATGTAAAIEMARVLKLANYQPAYTIRFMGFAAEEAGLRGSASYAQRARTANRDIQAMLNYDMIGNRTQSSSDRDVNVVWYVGSEALSNLHVAAARMYTSITPILSTSSRSGSDSYSFWQQSYKSVFLIERDFSPYYHSTNDLLQYLDMPYCRDIVRSGLATLITLDQMPPQVARLQLRDCGDGGSLYVAWDSVTVLDLASYKIYVGRMHGIYDTSFTQTTRSRRIAGLTTGQGYVVGVSMVDIAGREGMITELSAIPFSVPNPPAGFTVHSVASGFEFHWRKNSEMDLHGYNIYRKMNTEPAFSKLNASPIPDSTYTDDNTNAVVRHYYVTAIDSIGNESATSETLRVVPSATIDSKGAGSAFTFTLHQNYPNPFNPSTQIRYEIGSRSQVELKVFDMLGREVATLVNENKAPGEYVAVWNAMEQASGVYYCQLKAGKNVTTNKLVFMK